MRVTLAISIALALLLGACDEQSKSDAEATAEMRSMTPQWRDMPDGSKFAQVTVGEGSSQREEAIRCWPDGKRFLCINAGKNPVLGNIISRDYEDKLPSTLLGYVFPNVEGYSCSDFLHYKETITKGDKALVSNSPDYDTSPWTRGYVTRFMAENDVHGTPYYDCLHILEAVNQGSLATLGTTLVKRRMIY